MSNNRVVYTNPTYQEMWKPEVGPVTPWGIGVAPGQKNILTGFVQDEAINDFVFEQQHHKFQTKGQATDPGNKNKTVFAPGELLANGN
jgi:pre-mRNA-processing factor 17